MTLVEVLPEVQTLSRDDKIRLIHFLAEDLKRDDVGIEPGKSYPIWSPDQAYSAATLLLEALAEDRARQ